MSSRTDIDFTQVTELAGDEVSREQVQRIHDRYGWAAPLCAGCSVLEVACGTGQGLGYLLASAGRVVAGDLNFPMLKAAQAHYGARIPMALLDGGCLPFSGGTLDAVILFEAVYYLPDAGLFVSECRRILRPGGQVLLATANKDLADFNPSPWSVRYYGVPELRDLFAKFGFRTEFFGGTPVADIGMRQKIFRPLKSAASRLHLIPRTMAAKKLLKRMVFGRLVPMPAEIRPGEMTPEAPVPIPDSAADRRHKVIFCRAVRGAD